MAWKFYAVRRGKTTGIVRTWAECQEMTAGISHAEFKGFNSEDDALEYMRTGKIDNPSGLAIKKPESEDEVNVYARGQLVDDRMFIGVVLDSQQKKYQFFGEIVCGTDLLSTNGFGGELVATLIAVQLCKHIGFTKLNIVAAYDGVEKWYDGSWAARSRLSIDYSALMTQFRVKGLMKYNFLKATKQMCVPGVVEADKMVTRAKNMHQYIDVNKVMRGAMEVRDIPLYSIS